MSTLVRVSYFSDSQTCDETETPDSKKFNPKLNLIHVGKDQSKEENLKTIVDYLNVSADKRTNKYKPSVALNETVLTKRSSFRELIVGIQR